MSLSSRCRQYSFTISGQVFLHLCQKSYRKIQKKKQNSYTKRIFLSQTKENKRLYWSLFSCLVDCRTQQITAPPDMHLIWTAREENYFPLKLQNKAAANILSFVEFACILPFFFSQPKKGTMIKSCIFFSLFALIC